MIQYSPPKLVQEMGESDVQIQAQEQLFRLTLIREKPKASRHSLEEVGRSLNAVAQRRRQYFLDYKICNTIRLVRQWYAWETKRNSETNAPDAKNDNAAIRGIKSFLQRIDFYTTLLQRFVQYILQPLQGTFNTKTNNNVDLVRVIRQMKDLKTKCEKMLSDHNEVSLENVNHGEAEKRFPVISILTRVHNILVTMVTLSFQWRLHARFEQQFEDIERRKSDTESESDLNEKRKILRNLEHQIRKMQHGRELLEDEISTREVAMTRSNFCDTYTRCMDKLEIVSQALDECKLEIMKHDTNIKSAQQRVGKYKIVGPKHKKKLESSIARRTIKASELQKIQSELDRLQEHKAQLDDEEVAWLRGGYDSEMNIIESLRTQAANLEEGLKNVIDQKFNLKHAYDRSLEEVIHLENEQYKLLHKYEYVKSLASQAMHVMFSSYEQYVTVKCNKVATEKLTSDAYDMTQPKGVAMVIYNAWKNRSPRAASKAMSPVGGDTRRHELGSVVKSLAQQLGFYLIERGGLGGHEMKRHVIGLSDQYHGYSGTHNSLLVLVVARGDDSARLTDSGTSVGELTEHFTATRCPTLIGKPKIFLVFVRVTAHDHILSATGGRSSTKIFQPEPLQLEDDFLVVRLMCMDDTKSAQTFGGVTNIEPEIPWFVDTFVKGIAAQAGSKDLVTILTSIKTDLRQQHADSTARYEVGKELMGTDQTSRVELFVDNKLTKKLYLLPGL